MEPSLFLGLEGSANKLGIGVVDSRGKILSNVRDTYITPPGSGFLPRETALHHREYFVKILKRALSDAGVALNQISAICYTKGAKVYLV